MSKSERPRSASIARRLNRHFRWQQLVGIIVSNIMVTFLAVCFWCHLTEVEHVDAWSIWMRRELILGRGALWDMLKSAVYTFTPRGVGVPTYTVDAGRFLTILCAGAGIILALRLVGWLFKCASGTAEIRHYLKPIDDIAQAAERASVQRPDESMFRGLEDAIDHINAATPDAKLTIGHTELAGIEEAINNLMRRMHESYRQQVRFVDDASHELRTPIAVIQGYANMLDRWGKEDETVLSESISAIKTESDHMKTLVEQLLFLARGDMGRQQFEPIPLSLGDMLREIHEESEMIDPKHPYVLQLQAECTANADPAMLKQAVRILVDNAAKYTQEGGRITLRLRRDGKDAPCIDVQDSGIGVGDEDVPHMFERFYRSDAARSMGGSGLGLSIAKWIIDRHGGYFEVVSAEGAGTRVSIHLAGMGEGAIQARS